MESVTLPLNLQRGKFVVRDVENAHPPCVMATNERRQRTPLTATQRQRTATVRQRTDQDSIIFLYLVIPNAAPFHSTMPSEFTGLFGGFVFTAAGKRRLLLRQGERELMLKVPRVLRRRIIGKFRTGEPMRVAVVEDIDDETGARRQVVTEVLPDMADFPVGTLPFDRLTQAAPCIVRVCSKKNCWRNGGRELWEALEQQSRARGPAGKIEVRQVGCMDRCKQSPNVDCGNRIYTRCTTGDARSIIAHAIDAPLPREAEKG